MSSLNLHIILVDMKKLILLLFLIPILSCSQNRDNRFHDDGVVINGVRWATRNVGTTPGTFADSPEDFGGHFMWNRRPRKRFLTFRYYRGSSASVWQIKNDPCPRGWRVPTAQEVAMLRDYMFAGSRRFECARGVTIRSNEGDLFFPFAGLRKCGTFRISYAGENGFYWTSTMGGQHSHYSNDAVFLMLTRLDWEQFLLPRTRTSIIGLPPYLGMSVRCVAK